MTKNFRPIPLAPWPWIANEIGYFKIIELPVGAGVIKQPHVANVDVGEFPAVTPELKSLLRALSIRKADPTYILACIYFFCNPNKRVNITVLAQKEVAELKNFIEKLQLAPEKFSKIIKPDLNKRLKNIIDEIINETMPLLDQNVVASILEVPKNDDLPKRGRPSDHYHDLLILTIFRHFKEKLRVRSGHDGCYRVLLKLLRLVFPKTYETSEQEPLEKKELEIFKKQKSLEERIRGLKRDKRLLNEVFEFERKYKGIGAKFHESLKEKSEFYDDLYKHFF